MNSYVEDAFRCAHEVIHDTFGCNVKYTRAAGGMSLFPEPRAVFREVIKTRPRDDFESHVVESEVWVALCREEILPRRGDTITVPANSSALAPYAGKTYKVERVIEGRADPFEIEVVVCEV